MSNDQQPQEHPPATQLPPRPPQSAVAPGVAQPHAQQPAAPQPHAQPQPQVAYTGAPGGYAPNQHPGAYAPQQQYAPRSSEPGFFRALFDLSFSNYVTLKFAKFIYIIVIVLNILSWLGLAIFTLIGGAAAASYSYGGGGGLVMGFVVLLFGWIPALWSIILWRVFIEFVVASIRTAQNTTKIVNK